MYINCLKNEKDKEVVMELIKEIPKGIIRWYSFPAYSKILCITQTYNDSDTIFNTIK